MDVAICTGTCQSDERRMKIVVRERRQLQMKVVRNMQGGSRWPPSTMPRSGKTAVATQGKGAVTLTGWPLHSTCTLTAVGNNVSRVSSRTVAADSTQFPLFSLRRPVPPAHILIVASKYSVLKSLALGLETSAKALYFLFCEGGWPPMFFVLAWRFSNVVVLFFAGCGRQPYTTVAVQ
jgi:hypothetical protein